VGRGVAITAFGRFAVTAGSEDRTAAFSLRARRSLAHLALRDGPADRGSLAAELWPDEPEAHALANLRRRLHELDRALQAVGLESAIERTRSKIALAPHAQWAIDVARYAILARDARHARRAAEMYEEPIFPGVDDDVLERERRRLHAAQTELLTQLLDIAIRQSDVSAIVAYTDAVVRFDPLSERSIAKALDALDALGESDRARRLRERYERALRDEVDAEPSRVGYENREHDGAAYAVLQPLIARAGELRGATAAGSFDELEARMPEIRAALEAAIVRQQDVELGARALAALSRFFFDRGHTVEAHRWYDSTIPRLSESSALRAEMLYLRAMVGRNLGNTEHNLPAFEEAIEALRRVGERTTLAKAMLYASNAARMTGRVRLSEELACEGFTILEESRDPYLIAFARSALGASVHALGRIGQARAEFEAAKTGFAALGATDDASLMLMNVGRCDLARGDLHAARRQLMAAREGARGSGNVYIEGHAEVGLTLVTLDLGDHAAACGHAARAAAVALNSSDTELAVIALEAAGELFLALGEAARARDAIAAADGVRSEFLIARAPTEHLRCERVRAALADRDLLVHGPLAAPDVMLRSLLASVARSYGHIL
jgi:DNA-binding SARP family transcriptional activator